MDFDPVLLARLQFAFTISFHIIFPSFTIGLAAYIATLLGDVAAHRAGPLSVARAVLDQDLRGLVRHGRRLGHRAFLPVRHQLEPLLGRHRQRDRARDRLRGAHRLLPRSDVPRRAAVRLESRAALALGAVRRDRRIRHRGLGILDSLGQQLDADADGPRGARRHRLSGRLARDHLQSELPVSPRPHAHGRVPDDRASSCWRSARAISWQNATRPTGAPWCAWRSA